MTNGLTWRGGEAADLNIVGARVLDPREGIDGRFDIRIESGVITAIGESTADAREGARFDASGMIVTPAFTDPHVHLRTPGQEGKETLATGTAAGAVGGYCQLIAMPNTSPTIDGPDILRGVLARAAAEAVIPMGQMGAVTLGIAGESLTEMDLMRDAGAVGLTDDGMPVTDAGVLRRALRYQALVGLTIALHEEDPTLSLGAPMNEGEVSARLGLRGQTGLAESTMIARDCALAEAEGARIHIQHVSDARSIEAIRLAKGRGLEVTAEASPHHLLLTDGACSSLDTRTKMNPPLRFESDRLALIEGLADGTIDCVATDHAPHTSDEKEQPFEDAPFGVTGLETAFAALHQELVDTGAIELGVLVERMTSGCIPFGIPEPRIKVGRNADIAVFDPTAAWVAGEGGWASRSANSAFAGRRFDGRIVMTLADGVVVHRLEGNGARS